MVTKTEAGAAGLAAILLLLAFAGLAFAVLHGDMAGFDSAVAGWLQAQDGSGPAGPPWLLEAARDITALGSVSLLGTIVVAGGIYLLGSGQARSAVLVAVAAIGSFAASSVVKHFFDRPRPDLEGATRVFTSSFPSSHAATSAATYLTIGLLLAATARRTSTKVYWLGWAVLLVAVIGLTRIYLRVHFPSDILAGWILGTEWTLICWGVAAALRARAR